MKRFPPLITALLFLFAILFAAPATVLASEGSGEHLLEVEVNGYQVALSSQNEWVKGENTIVVTISDEMGMPVRDADVEILITPKADTHEESESSAHAGSGSDSQAEAESSHTSMSGMDMGEPEPETSELPEHEQGIAAPQVMIESHEHGEYTATTQIGAAGEYEAVVVFHANGEMMQAIFTVDIPGMASRTIVLWSFFVLNAGLVVWAGVLKKQSITVKGK